MRRKTPVDAHPRFICALLLRLLRHLSGHRIALSAPPFDEAGAVGVLIILVVPKALASSCITAPAY